VERRIVGERAPGHGKKRKKRKKGKKSICSFCESHHASPFIEGPKNIGQEKKRICQLFSRFKSVPRPPPLSERGYPESIPFGRKFESIFYLMGHSDMSKFKNNFSVNIFEPIFEVI
jgi:hypothetical protein